MFPYAFVRVLLNYMHVFVRMYVRARAEKACKGTTFF